MTTYLQTIRSLRATVDRAARYLPPALATPSSIRRVGEMAAHLSADVAAGMYLECWLTNAPDRVDMIIPVEHGAWHVVAEGRWPATPAAMRLRGASDAWRRVEQFCASFVSSSYGIDAGVRRLWLEFDARHDDPRSNLQPSVFVGFAPRRVTRWTPRDTIAAIASTCAPLTDDRDGLERGLLRACAALPAGSWIDYLGFMIGRGVRRVRACIAVPAGSAVDGAWLSAALPSSNQIDRLRPFALPPGPRDEQVWPRASLMHVEIVQDDDRVTFDDDAAGVEFCFARRRQLAGAFAETSFLHALAVEGLCPVDVAEQAPRWAGVERIYPAPSFVPSVMLRRINHVKLVARAGEALSAKLYLLAAQRPLQHDGGWLQ